MNEQKARGPEKAISRPTWLTRPVYSSRDTLWHKQREDINNRYETIYSCDRCPASSSKSTRCLSCVPKCFVSGTPQGADFRYSLTQCHRLSFPLLVLSTFQMSQVVCSLELHHFAIGGDEEYMYAGQIEGEKKKKP